MTRSRPDPRCSWKVLLEEGCDAARYVWLLRRFSERLHGWLHPVCARDGKWHVAFARRVDCLAYCWCRLVDDTRWLYHGVEFFMRSHNAHHEEPNAYVGAPPFIGVALIFLLIYLPVELAGLTIASGLTTGVLAGYMAYQLVHHATHFWLPARGTYLYRARLRHSRHHYQRKLGNFGITTVLWDQVFGSAIHTSPNTVAAVRNS
jgi:sterol desaturase/sphingolipid hydroxylase (fatty acid hydroxylase superfamily)